ncbi:hypothetical protein DM02DRAFT_621115 [Periconia macrospinosa]|uniref:Uncharacterized protein n=1 Tax=Periconia macrospinosa TaxID=97972 RepID=A0A2V1CWY4_9PLEO|nr:hypothetical protein DM02DRAFT_621115 [Periconia macrospinosa]
MTIIKARATAEEARSCAGHSRNQWRQFMKITRKEAEQLLSRCAAVSTWVDVSDKDQRQVLTAVNLQLQEKDIPEVTLPILNWRMPKAMWEHRKSNKTISQAELGQSQHEQLVNDTPAIPARASYYDPTRDA